MTRRYGKALLLITILVCGPRLSWGQTATPPTQATPSLSEPLERAYKRETQLHILYVHGMGIDTPKQKHGTQDFEVSQEFRTNFCKLIGCTTKMGELEGRDYADEGAFSPSADPPPLLYLRQEVWKRSSKEEWRASAPFVDHYKLVRKNGTLIFVDEINWWPLILSAKCRQIVGAEVSLVDRDQKHIATCSAKTVQDADHKGRYKSFAWITDDQKRDPSWPKPAVINRWLKHDILDWGFADALMAVGPMRQYLIEGIREIVLHSFNESENQEFVIVSHSLGSYLMFSALDLQDDPTAVAAHSMWKTKFEALLGETSHAYFMANQVRLLELANLDDTKNGNLISHLENWYDARHQAQQRPPQIVAWSDPDDLLTWRVPDLDRDAQGTDVKHVIVQNRPAQNTVRWFWLLENPTGAHTKYDQNKRVLRAMIPKPDARSSQEVNGTKPSAAASP
jgi:hypothetical protein